MMGIEINFNSNADEILKAFENASAEALEAIGLKAESHAKAETPVDTGRLRNSISHAVDGNDVYIGSNVEYAPFVELGTSRQKAHHMLEKAATQHSDEYKHILETAMKTT